MLLKPSWALPERNMWPHVFKFDTLKFLPACETSSCHSSKRSVSVQSKPGILMGSKKQLTLILHYQPIWYHRYHQGVSLAILFTHCCHVFQNLSFCHFPNGRKLLLLRFNSFAFFELRCKSSSAKELILN